MCGSDGLSSSSSLLKCGKSCRCQAETPLNALPSFTRPALTKPLPAQPHRASNRLVRGLGAPLEVQRYHQKIVAPGGLAFNAEHPVSQTRIVLECVADVTAVRIRSSVGLIA